jgi:hypothetical protein
MDNEDIDALVQCLHLLKQLDKLGQIDKRAFQGFDSIVKGADKVLKGNPNVVPNWYINRYWLEDTKKKGAK